MEPEPREEGRGSCGRARGGLPGFRKRRAPGRRRPPSPLGGEWGLGLRGGDPREGRHSQGPRAPPGTSWRLRSASLGRGIRGGPLGWAPPLWASLSPPAKWALTSAPGSRLRGMQAWRKEVPAPPEIQAQEPNTAGPAAHLAATSFLVGLEEGVGCLGVCLQPPGGLGVCSFQRSLLPY